MGGKRSIEEPLSVFSFLHFWHPSYLLFHYAFIFTQEYRAPKPVWLPTSSMIKYRARAPSKNKHDPYHGCFHLCLAHSIYFWIFGVKDFTSYFCWNSLSLKSIAFFHYCFGTVIKKFMSWKILNLYCLLLLASPRSPPNESFFYEPPNEYWCLIFYRNLSNCILQDLEIYTTFRIQTFQF